MTGNKTPELKRMIGQLPPPWDRSVVFFANLRALFYSNEAQRDWLCQEIKGIGSYGGRLLPLLNLMYHGADNVLVVEEGPNEVLMRYYLNQLGLTLPQVEVLPWDAYLALDQENETVTRMRQLPAPWAEGYVTDPFLAHLAERLDKKSTTSATGSITGNNKLLFHQFMEQRELPVFTTEYASTVEEIPPALERLIRQGYTDAVVKSQIGASGIGLVKLACTDADLGQIHPSMFHEGVVMVQGWIDASLPEIDAIGSPSVQLFVQEDTVYLYDLTEQLLSADHLHQGNIAPPPYLNEFEGITEDLLSQAEQAATWLHQTGYRGTASVDFIVIQERGTVKAIACEINARVTGATYPSMLARHFAPEEAWLMRNLQSHQPVEGKDILYALDQAALLYHPGNERGVLPINFNLDEQGLEFKGQFLCIAPTTEACYSLLREADELDTADWTHARD